MKKSQFNLVSFYFYRKVITVGEICAATNCHKDTLYSFMRHSTWDKLTTDRITGSMLKLIGIGVQSDAGEVLSELIQLEEKLRDQFNVVLSEVLACKSDGENNKSILRRLESITKKASSFDFTPKELEGLFQFIASSIEARDQEIGSL